MNYGRYQIISELGRGSMGMVYKAHDPQIDRMVALKVLREDRLTSEDYVQRFLKEATAIGRLSHPGIVTVYDVGQDHGTIYIAMEFLEGRPLDELVKSGSLSLHDIVNVGIQVAKALHYAHKRGIVHRDIKPPNIIYTPEMTIKVTDFGIAHIDDPDGQQMTRAGEILGTPVYMAPEQVMGQIVDGRSDLYSLGVILYELTTGRRPFQGENLAAVFRAITNDDPVPPDQLNPDIPPTFSQLILKAMAKKPENRIGNGQELAGLLDTCLDNQAHESFTETVIQKTPAKHRSSLGLIFTAMFLLCGVGLFAYLYLLSPRTEEKQPPDNTIQVTEQSQETAPAEEKLSSVAPILPVQDPETTSTPITLTPDKRKINKQAPVERKTAFEPDSVIPSKSETKPAMEDSFLPQQAADAIDDLFKENRNDKPSISAPIDSGEPEPPLIPKEDDTPLVSQPAIVKSESTSLLLVSKEPRTDVHTKMATLAIDSRPSGARLYIDGNYQGLTPIEVETTAMKHEVKLELQGHLGWQAQLNLSKGGKVPVTIPLLAE